MPLLLDKTSSTWVRSFRINRRKVSRKIFSLFGSFSRLLNPKEKFCIKPGYYHAGSIFDFDDTSNTDQWQKEVYLLAADLMKEKGYVSVIDIGCGSAYKLIHYFEGYKTTGIEVEPIYKWLKQHYPNQEWLQVDHVDPESLQADMIICSDVIEHIKNPDTLLQFISSIKSRHIMISTPERDAISGSNDYGPPANPSHYREWNADEFKKYISRWFVIQEQRIFDGLSTTQVIVCKK